MWGAVRRRVAGRPVRRGAILAVVVTVAAAITAMTPVDSAASVGTGPVGLASSGSPLSIVQLGDSVASGEGTLYGYTYDASTRTWVGGVPDPTWSGPYPLCHDSPDAYGQLVSTDLGAQFHQFACTGASFDNGIAAPRVDKGYLYDTTLRPAEFGDWAKHSDLNQEYDVAKPDVVLVTLGADDVQFVSIVESCIENAYEYSLDLADLQCVQSNPGPTITQDFTDALPRLADNYRTLVSWIQERGRAEGRVPKVVFTNYYNPLPPNGQLCPDSNYLRSDQIEYLSTLLDRLNSTITGTIDALHDPGVAVADIAQALRGHEWCSSDPWAYGLSIYSVTSPSTFASQAPFHPTPRGQQAIAADVEPVVQRLLSGQG